MYVLAVPEKPSGVRVNASTPNTVRLQVLPPTEYNGLDLLGYRVKYEDVVYDFDAGNYSAPVGVLSLIHI